MFERQIKKPPSLARFASRFASEDVLTLNLDGAAPIHGKKVKSLDVRIVGMAREYVPEQGGCVAVIEGHLPLPEQTVVFTIYYRSRSDVRIMFPSGHQKLKDCSCVVNG
jgi:hypothetical protein